MESFKSHAQLLASSKAHGIVLPNAVPEWKFAMTIHLIFPTS